MLGKGAISSSSMKQKTMALSAVEANYLSMSHAFKEVLWMKHLEEIAAETFSPSLQVLRVNNQGAIALAKNYVTLERNKHIRLRHFLLREKVEVKQINFECVPICNTAVMLTKPLRNSKT